MTKGTPASFRLKTARLLPLIARDRLNAAPADVELAAPGLPGSPMMADERADLVLAFAKSLYVNGQATEQMVDAAKRLGRALGLRATIIPRWGELQLVADSEHAALAVQSVAAPASVEMERVASTMRAIEDISAGRLAPEAAKKTIDEISRKDRHDHAGVPSFLMAGGEAGLTLFEIIRTTGWMRRLRPDPCRTNALVFEHRMSAMSRSGRICANAIT